jgi:hydrogenase expression/formation protein HypD
MPPILRSILREKQKGIHGIICPGHVAAVKGAGYFRFITFEYGVSAAICGFEPLDIAAGLYFLSRQYSNRAEAGFSNLYRTCVAEEGNRPAEEIMQEVYEIDDASWRGIGEIPESALILCEKYAYFDALKRFNIRLSTPSANSQCNCRDVLLGNIVPYECKLFGKRCTPQKPIGPCMISNEGSCSTYYRYRECR